MTESQQRLSAQAAIEVLKFHQLRRENVVIFNEIKQLRGEVTSRQSELDEARKQVDNLKSELREVQGQNDQHGAKLRTFEAAVQTIEHSIQDSQREQVLLKDSGTKAQQSCQTSHEEAQTAIEKLNQDLTQLRDRIDGLQDDNAQIIDGMQASLGLKASNDDLLELQNALDDLSDLVQQIEPRLAAHEDRFSKVTDSAEPLTFQTSDSAFASGDDYDNSLWKPIGQQNDKKSSSAANLCSMASRRNRQSTGDQAASSVLSPARGLQREVPISNISHGSAPQDRSATKIAAAPVVEKNVTTEHEAYLPVLPPKLMKPNPLANTANQNTEPQAVKIGSEAVRPPLQALLRLKQDDQESLIAYFDRFHNLVSPMPAVRDVLSICLRRFMKGLGSEEERAFIEEWLSTSTYSLLDARDAVVLLSCSQKDDQCLEIQRTPSDEHIARPELLLAHTSMQTKKDGSMLRIAEKKSVRSLGVASPELSSLSGFSNLSNTPSRHCTWPAVPEERRLEVSGKRKFHFEDALDAVPKRRPGRKTCEEKQPTISKPAGAPNVTTRSQAAAKKTREDRGQAQRMSGIASAVGKHQEQANAPSRGRTKDSAFENVNHDDERHRQGWATSQDDDSRYVPHPEQRGRVHVDTVNVNIGTATNGASPPPEDRAAVGEPNEIHQHYKYWIGAGESQSYATQLVTPTRPAPKRSRDVFDLPDNSDSDTQLPSSPPTQKSPDLSSRPRLAAKYSPDAKQKRRPTLVSTTRPLSIIVPESSDPIQLPAVRSAVTSHRPRNER